MFAGVILNFTGSCNNMHTRAICTSALLFTIVLAGCATLLKGNKEDVMITSDPTGASVSINGQPMGTTPYVARVASSKDLDVELSKPGYKTTKISDPTSMRKGWEAWSFVAYVIPMGVDMASGAAWGHNQTMLAAHLEPDSPPPPAVRSPAMPAAEVPAPAIAANASPAIAAPSAPADKAPAPDATKKPAN